MKDVKKIIFIIALFSFSAVIFGQQDMISFYKERIEESLSRNRCDQARGFYEDYKKIGGKPDSNIETRIRNCREGTPPPPPPDNGIEHTVGLTAGILDMRGVFSYADFISRTGFRAGLRYRLGSLQNQPPFSYGFGLQTGILYEYQVHDYDYGISESYNRQVINFPLHPELSLNVLKGLNIYFYIGPSLDFVITSQGKGSRTDIYLGGGGGIRISRVQFNLGYDENLATKSAIRSSQQKSSKISLSLSFLF